MAGTGVYGYSGDGGPATAAQLGQPQSVHIDAAGNLYIADWANNAIRMVTPDGIITTVAGTGETGYSGDGGPATEARLNHPPDMVTDAYGNLFIVDWSNHVRKVDSSGIITTVAGTGETGYSGDGGPATQATFNLPSGIEVQGSGNLFVSDYYNHAIRRIDTSGIIDTVAGMGSPGYSGDGGYAPFALLNQPVGIELDPEGNLYIAESGNHVIRRLVTSYLWVGREPEPAQEGQNFTYDLNISGLPTRTTGVTLTANLAPEVGFVAVTTNQGTCRQRGSTITCRLGAIDPGQTARVLVTVTAQGSGVVPITATATAIPEPRTVTAYSRISSADCGQTISESTVLAADIGPCAGNGVIIGASDITFDLGGHRIFGFPGPGTGNDAGVRLPAKYRVTVRNGTVSEFDAGVVINKGRGNTITAMTITDNVGPDDAFNAELGDGIVVFDSPANHIMGNTLS
ncbi:MAG: DUF11 domain-containing protein, partial [Actinobacteria bacterium]|nr:DUF11 domain-containing protein [Actinomycetota bacterium]